MPRSRRRNDDDDDDDRPVRKSRSRRDDEDDEDDDEEDERPSRKKARSRRDDEDDEDDEDEDERPRKKLKKKAKRKSGPPVALFLGIGGGAVVLLLIAGIAAFFLFLNDTPEKAFQDVKTALLNKDYGRMYDRMDKDTQQDFERQAELMMKFDKSLAVHNGKKGRELFVAVNKDLDTKGSGMGANFSEKMREDIRNTTVEKVVVNGDTATLTLKNANGRTDTGTMVKQDGTWRIKKK